MTILKERGFTEAPMDKFARKSFAGMAHFAGTGPGAGCATCRLWDKENQRNDAARCKKYQAITGKPGNLVPGTAASCKYFEQT